MTKKLLINQVLLVFLLVGIGFQSCKKDDIKKKQAEKDEQIIKDYLATNQLEALRHESGLYYIIIEEGSGAHPTVNSTVKVLYKGYLTNGEIFDQTNQDARVFKLKNLIEGWRIGIPMLKEGGSGIFLIPSAMGYGSNQVGAIPPNSVIIFEIELLSIL
ncbi:MAG TPA: FKBP-type peptidyl-prolyl cis-trans isomerase [Bacteroidales bacterium]|jgi:FKBP-type peptidyl-prolyl cis-trans isomerase FkpA|nr:FKBP-type peptidyl-prolyl cis-trans isomerase [Bacteroidales bacterium]MBP7873974.1 FKBP-type peptidyl-prolyl cis-trans isomerase [Bacteroidales bacterium]MCZ2282037.1 FKBP-type peptidyl-prolyl cis-trans isomerase [Bacteroidales bacterium]NLH32808.1 peptidylprolyl isomerase [Lentimicrobium sp.]HPX33824.1 FKBP-type peptidyl-prolyl cis-trans isomerase [Bacteroidales bacterium]